MSGGTAPEVWGSPCGIQYVIQLGAGVPEKKGLGWRISSLREKREFLWEAVNSNPFFQVLFFVYHLSIPQE